MKNPFLKFPVERFIVLCVLVLIAGSVSYVYFTLTKQIGSLQEQLASTITDTNQQIQTLNNDISTLANQGQTFVTKLDSASQQSSDVATQIGQVTATVGSLDKLSKIDPQLLQKYSKVYFLNENYIPSSLSTIPTQYTYETDTQYQFLTPALPFLTNMIDAAKADGVNLLVISAYRSFGRQAALKSSYTVTYGAGTANQFSADQGYSEHQLGTAVDLTSPQVAATFTGFENTPEYAWLVAHAYQYGFILSYPPDNEYYEYEPWHWRFVGVALATKLHTDGKYFYDYDQRTIDDFLSTIFD